MKTWQPLGLQALTLGLVLATHAADNRPGPSALADYIARPDPDFGWTERSVGRLGDTQYVELTLVSQEWQGITWKHQLYIVKPSSLNPQAKHGMMVIAGRSWKDEYDLPTTRIPLSKSAPVYAELAEKIGTPVAILLQVPFQPLFNNLTEDWLIAYTFDQYLRSGNEHWPLLLPMVKSVVRAMDAVQGYTKKKWDLNLETFTVTGASKRGWTTWLTGAVDPRATAIVPMVIDVLNMAPHMRRAKAVWGGPSEKIEPYTNLGLLEKLETDDGRRLLKIVDPYSYRKSLDQPKLIINGTNDDYWVTDATNLYWDDLPGEKHLLYVPNNDHSLKDFIRVIGSTLALHQHQSGQTRLPDFTWTHSKEGPSLVVRARATPRPHALRVWTTESPIPDLRDAKWTSRPLPAEPGEAEYRLTPNARHQAFFIEAEFREGRPVPLYLSTTMRVLPPAGVESPVAGAP